MKKVELESLIEVAQTKAIEAALELIRKEFQEQAGRLREDGMEEAANDMCTNIQILDDEITPPIVLAYMHIRNRTIDLSTLSLNKRYDLYVVEAWDKKGDLILCKPFTTPEAARVFTDTLDRLALKQERKAVEPSCVYPYFGRWKVEISDWQGNTIISQTFDTKDEAQAFSKNLHKCERK